MNVPFSSFVISVLWNCYWSFVHFSRRQYIQHFVADFASVKIGNLKGSQENSSSLQIL